MVCPLVDDIVHNCIIIYSLIGLLGIVLFLFGFNFIEWFYCFLNIALMAIAFMKTFLKEKEESNG